MNEELAEARRQVRAWKDNYHFAAYKYDGPGYFQEIELSERQAWAWEKLAQDIARYS